METRNCPLFTIPPPPPNLNEHEISKNFTLKTNNEPERYLGIRLSPSGNMATEFKYRLEQTDRLENYILASHLSPYETNIFYQQIWLPKVEYCLPITSFSRTQCQKIHAKILKSILTKLHFNRNLPRAIVHGPKCRGGLGLTELYDIQGSMQICEVLYHLRKNDNIGTLIQISMRYLQLESGQSESVFTGNFMGYEYVSHTWCAPLWLYLTTIQGEILIDAHTNYVPQRSEDKHIMDDMCLDYQGRQLRQINQCRLWLHVITYADIISHDGNIILEWDWKGTSPAPSILNWPTQGKPDKSAWRTWRSALKKSLHLQQTTLRTPLGNWNCVEWHIKYQHYISPTKKLIYDMDKVITYHQILSTRLYKATGLPSLNQPDITWVPIEITQLGSQYLLAKKINVIQYQTPPASNTLYNILHQLPKGYQSVLSNIHLPHDDGTELYQQLLNKTLLCGSDGSVRDEVAGYAYKLVASLPENCLWGSNVCPPTLIIVSSLRAEIFGSLAVALSIELLLTKYSITEQNAYLTIIDNKTVVDRINSTNPPSKKKNYLIPEYELFYQVNAILQTSNATGTWKWVKAHRSGNDPEITLNNEMDSLAKQAVNTPSIHDTHTKFPKGCPSLQIKGLPITSNYRRSIKEAASSRKLEVYMKRKKQWTTST